MKSWDNTILGTLVISGSTPEAKVNSEKRARPIEREIRRRLGERAKLEATLRESLDQLPEQLPEQPSP